MNPEENLEKISARLRQLEVGVRIFAVTLVAVLAYFNLRLAFIVPAFKQIFIDMLGNKPLPWLTGFIVQAHFAALAVGIMLPLLAILLACIIRSPLRLFISLSIIVVLSFVQIVVTWTGLFAPLMSVIENMQATI